MPPSVVFGALQGRTLYMLALQGQTLLYKLYCICLIPWGLCRVPRGEIPEQKTDAYISGVWYTITRNQMKYNRTGKQITFENLAGQLTTTAWDCCLPTPTTIVAADKRHRRC